MRRVQARVNDATQGALVIYGRFYGGKNPEEARNASPTFFRDFQTLLEEAAASNILMYTVSRRTATKVNHRMEPYNELTHHDFIHEPLKLLPQFFSYEKAAVKLSWLLRYYTPEHAAELMSQNLVGEFLTSGQLPDQFKSRGYPPNNPAQGMAVVVSFSGMEADVIHDAVECLLKQKKMARRILYLYGWGDGNLPFEADSIHELLADSISAHDLPHHLRELAAALLGMPDWDGANGLKNLFSQNPDENTLFRLVKEALLRLSTEKRRRLLAGYQINVRRLPPAISPQAIEENFSDLCEELTKRVIKDFLMHVNPMLRELGRAVDYDIKVVMRTQAFGSKANLMLYELGQMSYAVGVRDELNRPWMRGIFTPLFL